MPGLISSLALSPAKATSDASPAAVCEPARAAALAALARPGARYAYVTLLTKDAYLPGVQALHRSLRLVGARHPIIVLYTAGVGDAALGALREDEEGGVLLLRYTEQFEADGVDHSNYKRSLYLEVAAGSKAEHPIQGFPALSGSPGTS